jgi:hypothetical protein
MLEVVVSGEVRLSLMRFYELSLLVQPSFLRFSPIRKEQGDVLHVTLRTDNRLDIEERPCFRFRFTHCPKL